MAIFYMDVKIIGRSSGRSSVGAAAYRAGEKLHSIAHASYQSGEKLKGKGGKITHDYTKKKGVVHSEILLPENAPPEYKDRETLWNAVELSETRKNSQLAREIIVALPKELKLNEQIELLRAYVQENFVKIGICADIAIHDNDDGNPHAHIMLTTREVTRDGFGKKNREWNKKETLLSWRKAWAHTINRVFMRKGLDARIDHRSYKEQGIDRQATIHLGHQAEALEKKGVKTERGDYNREVRQGNEIRAALNAAKFKLVQEKYASQKTTQYIEKSGAQHEDEKILLGDMDEAEKAEKTSQIIEKMHTPHLGCTSETEKLPLYMDELQGNYSVLEREIAMVEARDSECRQKITKIDNRLESIDEDDENIKTLQGRGAELKAESKKLHAWQIRRKKKIDRELKQIETTLKAAQNDFWRKYLISYDKASVEIERIHKEKRLKTLEYEKNKARAVEIAKDMEAIIAEYRAQKLIVNAHPDKDKIYERLERFRRTPSDIHVSPFLRIRKKSPDEIIEDLLIEIIEELSQNQRKRNRTKTKRISRPR
jgi:hypothetical protein